jgi:hypothetical protein
MIASSNKDYLETKLIKQGKRKLNPDFVGLAEWINEKFNVGVINIYYDTIDDKEKRPRLCIILEYHNDELKFRNGGNLGNYNNKKQKIIADKFKEIVNHETNIKSIWTKLFHLTTDLKYNTDNIFVVFASFEPIAKDEANSSIPKAEIEKLKKELNCSDLWEIYRQFYRTIFFFHTDKQVQDYLKKGKKEEFSKIYFNLLKKYDEFDYFDFENFSIEFDSKENFDKNYESSWFYYSR